ncbi:unnamed protein product, partial [Prorocentrum cordatum]
VQTVFKPIVKLSSPDCRLWTAMSNMRGAGVAAAERQAEFPMLEWLYHDNVVQDRDGHGYVNENGLRSQLWTQSPLKQNQDTVSNRTRRVDGCAHDCLNANNEPLEKPYKLDSNIQLKKTIRRCPGHGVQRHAVIEGSVPGSSSKTAALTTMYTRTMCRALISDITSFARKFTCALMLATLVYSNIDIHHGSPNTEAERVQLLHPKATAPQLGSDGAAAHDITTITDDFLEDNGMYFIPGSSWHYKQVPLASCGIGDRIAQLMIVQTQTPPVKIRDHIDEDETERGKNGCGSTANGTVQMKVAYDRLRRAKVDDFTMNIHEQLKNLDQIWLARILADLAGQHTGILTAPNTQQQLNLGDDTDGTT